MAMTLSPPVANARWHLPFTPKYRRLWLPELALVLSCMALSTILFWFSPLDLDVSRLFFTSGDSPLWPLSRQNPWLFINRRGDVILAWPLIGGSLLMLVTGLFSARWKTLRRPALCVLLSIALGPGLLVNGLFKEHWGRPRPSQVQEFQGSHAHIPPLQMGAAGGNSSFPSGHASIAFSYVVFWFILQRRRPRLAMAALGFACALGGVMGFSRVASGAHFLSDILWAGYLSFLSALVSYHFILRIPVEEDEGRADPPVGKGLSFPKEIIL